MFSVTIRVNFEAAHRLLRYRGKCNNIHGHSYKAIVSVSSKVLSPDKKTPPGMVVDFSVLKREVKDICEYFDHKLILATGDPLANYLLNFSQHQKVIVLPDSFYDATAECMARYLYNLLIPLEEKFKVQIEEVTIVETENSQASYRRQ